MSSIFPKPITSLPEVGIPLEGVKGYLSQGENNQVIFMEFEKDVELPEHSHESQWEVVVEGKVDLVVEGYKQTFRKGERFFIPRGAKHSAKVYAGYTSVAFFNQKDRYKKK
ncbi:MAG: cupin domain-containing protein [Thermoplasmatales archaeon]|nr:MAG: cupin domain-containing protein [Thermoplasmatales archaeon]